MRITVLGKSPAWQDADGACSGYLVEGGGQTVLLDCGPGVFAKLRRHVDYVDVDAVVISHLHADHILDLVPFASGLRYAPRQQPVPVAGNPGTDHPARPRLFAPPGALEEQQGNDITRRVGALEVSLPKLLETLPDGGNIDRSNVTAAIGQDPALVYEAEGGSVVVRQQPMAEAQPAPAGTQPLPAPVEQQVAAIPVPNEREFGIALGPAIPFERAPEAWRDLSMKLGPLLFGLAPLLVEEANSDDQRIVVGPITQLSEATALCARLERLSVSCLPMPFTGTPLAY